MSSITNENLLERAVDVCEYFEGTDVERAILWNIARNDLEKVAHIVKEAEAEMSIQEFNNYDIY